MRQLLSLAVAGVLTLSGVARSAPILAYSSSASQPSDQNYGFSFGMDFTVNTPITLTGLGLYSSLLGNGTGTGFAGDDYVTLFNGSGGIVEQLEFGNGTGNGTLFSGTSDYVKPLVGGSIALPAGFSGSIVAFYGGGTDGLANVGAGAAAPAETGAPAISYAGSGRFTGSGDQNTYPTTTDTGPANRYNGPTFEFTVPEPGTLGLIGLSIVGFLARRRS